MNEKKSSFIIKLYIDCKLKKWRERGEENLQEESIEHYNFGDIYVKLISHQLQIYLILEKKCD